MSRPNIVRMLGLGKKIRQYRSEANITQRKMAKLLGIPYSTYSNYENDNRTPDADTLEKICDLLHISMNDLIGPVIAPSADNQDISDFIYRPMVPFTPENMETMAREHDLILSFRRLNITGQIEAIRRIQELTEISRYCEKSTDTPKETAESE